ncbi:acetylxylan esterase [Corallincola platygyrae]|uniref:Acetylxylan esterase n=1 Tax=Corallincola platygyrae TaxID=1193278 RepID=A0ABW4XKA1_9GAMM
MLEFIEEDDALIKEHPYKFDPSYGYSLKQLLTVEPSDEPSDFDRFWQKRYQYAMNWSPRPTLRDLDRDWLGWRVCEIEYTSTESFPIRGWLLLPRSGNVRRAFVIGHGYGGRDAPDFNLPFTDAALLFPCFRGLSLSQKAPISNDPQYHVLHNIDDPTRYVIGGCVDDVWLGISSLLRLFPQVEGHIGYLGISFGGGVGAMATAYDPRITRAHYNVPTFGHQPLRLTLRTRGSGQAVRRFYRHNPEITLRTLGYFDAATAAKRIKVPVHFACARFDPAVAPPGQFAVYNAVPGEKELMVLDAGHHEYPRQAIQNNELMDQLNRFFSSL